MSMNAMSTLASHACQLSSLHSHTNHSLAVRFLVVGFFFTTSAHSVTVYNVVVSLISGFSLLFGMAFCPVCGGEAVDVFCEEHLREQEPLIVEIKPFELVMCSTCDRLLERGSWQELARFEFLVKKALKLNARARMQYVHVPLPVFSDKPEDFELVVEVSGSVSEFVEPYVEEYVIAVPVRVDQCNRCAHSKSGYFEGILQLRNVREEVVAYIESAVARADNVRITKSKDVKGGIDFELTDQQWLISFVHELQKEFGGVVRKSSKLHTYDHQRSKKVYRLTCLLQLPLFGVGDVIQTRKRLMRVSSMGSVVKGFDLLRRKHTSTPCPVPGEYELLEVYKTTVSSTRPRVMILSPHDYQEVPLAHPAQVVAGQKVPVIEDSSGKWFVAKRLEE